ncbi:MAG: bifunctional phosphoribosylaminoimidazolecarboxamide formyltransferase/IMP cyclohydrolase [Deltaproteobacteria bacterium]|nr:bifunctional phosphoribosylaminoimidazolecarboxamide formyltransferase/IMP cyclohydrolase [Deltaproteobacteria bacterium]MBW2695130.1 bifunctional phosphoribosylaminoimidazolecarboxamide formyltransferase/IMP cyclohydrolase [Deltaproteobacteria bacterium]
MPPSKTPRPVARALLSVSDKTGLVELGKGLAALGIELVASGGTASALRDSGLTVLDVAELTASPEMLGGRVKTLHPKVHGGILARRDVESDRVDLAQNGIGPIDLVVVNLYPFEATVARPEVRYADAIEKIDIGGPSMLRSAAKNHEYVGVLSDPADYETVLAEIRNEGGLLAATRRRLALRAFRITAAYDAAIQAWLGGQIQEEGDDPLPSRFVVGLPRVTPLRYGENPHQAAALYGHFLDNVEQLHGKALSYNNLVDVQAALGLIFDFDPADHAAVGILKHNTPCGVGAGASPLEAYERAFETDPDSPFGGIIVSNVAFDLALAKKVDEIFTEVLVAPSFDEAALDLLRKKKNRRLLAFDIDGIDRAELDWRRVFGGVLLQQADTSVDELEGAKVVTKAQPSDEQRSALGFAWRVVKHVKSNAIVFADAGRTLGVGGGATSRVDAVHNAVAKAARVGLSLEDSVLASDAFFPFPDGLEAAVEAGARAVIQPGGSNRDELVIEAADRLGIPMIFTGVRHFRH